MEIQIVMRKNLFRLFFSILILWNISSKAQEIVIEDSSPEETLFTINPCTDLEQLLSGVQKPIQPLEYTQVFLILLSQCEMSLNDQHQLYENILNKLTSVRENNNNETEGILLVEEDIEQWKAVLSIANFMAQNTPTPSLNKLKDLMEKRSMKNLLTHTNGSQPFFIHNLVPLYQKNASTPSKRKEFKIQYADQKFVGTTHTILIEKNQAMCQSTSYYQNILQPMLNLLLTQVDLFLNQQEQEFMDVLYFTYILQEANPQSDNLFPTNHWSQMRLPFIEKMIQGMSETSKSDFLFQTPKVTAHLQLLALWINIYQTINQAILTHCIVDPNYAPRTWWKTYNIVKPFKKPESQTVKNKILFALQNYAKSLEQKDNTLNVHVDIQNTRLTFHTHDPVSSSPQIPRL